MAGTLTISTLSDGTNSTSATNCIQGSARAWLNYNGVTQTIAGSFNVSSVTYNGTGDYTVNFTTAMPNANYSVAGLNQADNVNDARFIVSCKYNARTTTSVGIFSSVTTAKANTEFVAISVFSS
jgi:hypothetical protein